MYNWKTINGKYARDVDVSLIVFLKGGSYWRGVKLGNLDNFRVSAVHLILSDLLL